MPIPRDDIEYMNAYDHYWGIGASNDEYIADMTFRRDKAIRDALNNPNVDNPILNAPGFTIDLNTGVWSIINNDAMVDQTGSNIRGGVTVDGFGKIPLANQTGVDWANVRSAGLGLIGGVAETFIGAATSETGVGAFAFFDGVGRIFTNATRLVGAFANNKALANGPSNWGGYVGKILDSAPLTNRLTNGNAQTILGISNDIGAFLVTGGNGSAIEMAISGSGLQQVAAITTYGINWYTIGDYMTTYGTKK